MTDAPDLDTLLAGAPQALAPIAHSNLGASVARRWLNCPGSPNLIRECPPQRGSVYAAEGTAAHACAALCLAEGRDAIETLDRRFGDFVVNDEMVEAVQVYLDTCRALCDTAAGDIIFIEEQFTLESLEPPEPMFGTADCCVYQAKAQKLIVIDFKYGKGVAVRALGNDQGRYYALGAALKLKHLTVREVEIIIVQPRAPLNNDKGVRSDTVSAYDLVDWASHLLEKAKLTQEPDAPRVAGDWCKFCPASFAQGPDGLIACDAYRNRALAATDATFDEEYVMTVQPPPVNTLSVAQLARVLSAGKLLQDWLKSAQALAFDLIQKGVEVPGWKTVPKVARRKWVEKDESIMASRLAIEADIPAEHLFVPKLKSPAQIEKGLSKVFPRDQVAEVKLRLATLAEKKSSGATLAPIDDPRPALPPNAELTFRDDYGDE